ncbi:MAG: hypothetical protein IT290_05155 [Deltaproteobacteria bacterium]|nr:hypothetical protein [Deltaproteobacteria bacterium]
MKVQLVPLPRRNPESVVSRSLIPQMAVAVGALFCALPLLFAVLLAELSPGPLSSAVKVTDVAVGTPEHPMAPELGNAKIISLTGLGLEAMADDSQNFRNNSPIVLLENGVPLRSHEVHDSIRKKLSGVFSHWASSIYFAPGTSAENASYRVVYPQLAPDTKALAISPMTLWGTVFALSILASLLIGNPRASSARWVYRGAFALALVGYLTYDITQVQHDTVDGTSEWAAFYYGPDSDSYALGINPGTVRPPVFPIFAKLVQALKGDLGKVTRQTTLELPRNVPITNLPEHPLLRVVKAQKLLLIVTAGIAALALMFIAPPPIVATFFAWMYAVGFFTPQINFVLSECVAQSCTFLLVAAFIWYVLRRSELALTALVFATAALYQTRSAGIFGVVFLGVGLLVGLATYRKRFFRQGALAVVLFGVLFWAPTFIQSVFSGHLAPAPMYADSRIAYAVQFAKPEDVALMPDEESKEFLRRVLQKKVETDALVDATGKPVIEALYLGANLYRAAMPVSAELGRFGPDMRSLFLKVSGPIIREHWDHQLRLLWESLSHTLSRETRVRWLPDYSFWHIAAGILFVALLLRGAEGLIAFTLLVAHIAHLAVVCAFDIPISRYVYATEFLSLLAVMVLASGVLRRIALLGSKLVTRPRGDTQSDESDRPAVTTLPADERALQSANM